MRREVPSFFALWRGRFDEYDDDWLRRYAWLRAVEWCGLPLFLAQPIAPLLLVIYLPAWVIIGGVLASSWLWRLVRYRLLGIRLVGQGAGPRLMEAKYQCPILSPLTIVRLADAWRTFVFLKWPVAIGCGLLLLRDSRYLQAALAASWPLVTMLLIPFGRAGGMIGAVQKRFLLAMGFLPITGDASSARVAEFYRPPLRCGVCSEPSPYPTWSSLGRFACAACIERTVAPVLAAAHAISRSDLKASLERSLESMASSEKLGTRKITGESILDDLLNELDVAPQYDAVKVPKRVPPEVLKNPTARFLVGIGFPQMAPRLRVRGLICRALEEASSRPATE